MNATKMDTDTAGLSHWQGIDCPDRAEEERLALQAGLGWLEYLLGACALLLLLAFCAGLAAQTGPEIELQCPPGTPIASGSTDTGWGPTIAQNLLYYRTVRVLNLGNAPLTLSGKGSVSGKSNCTTLWYKYGPPNWQNTLAAGEWEDFDMGVTPTASGAWSFTYSLTSDDTTGGESPYVITFTGTASASDVGVAPTLRVVTQPIGGLSGPSLKQQPEVEALDASGNRDTSFNGPVTVALMGGAGSTGQLGGTLTVNAVGGLASFTDLSATQTDSIYALYELKFSAGGFSDGHSQAFMDWNFSSNAGGPVGGGGGGGTGGSPSGGGGGGGGCVATESSFSIAMLAALAAMLIYTRRRRLARR